MRFACDKFAIPMVAGHTKQHRWQSGYWCRRESNRCLHYQAASNV
jgi:hypothetical protein